MSKAAFSDTYVFFQRMMKLNQCLVLIVCSVLLQWFPCCLKGVAICVLVVIE